MTQLRRRNAREQKGEEEKNSRGIVGWVIFVVGARQY